MCKDVLHAGAQEERQEEVSPPEDCRGSHQKSHPRNPKRLRQSCSENESSQPDKATGKTKGEPSMLFLQNSVLQFGFRLKSKFQNLLPTPMLLQKLISAFKEFQNNFRAF